MKVGKLLSAALIFAVIFVACIEQKNQGKSMSGKNSDDIDMYITDTATFGSGCFWCTEAIFQRLEGVQKVLSGYSGGNVPNPTYEQVCTGTTNHAEVCQIIFDPQKISFDELLEVFWKTHNPTTLNRQGNDVGTQYRSVIFYHNAAQKERAEEYLEALNKNNVWNAPVVTAIEPFKNFYAAEAYHRNYFNTNPKQQYCHFVILPKVEKFEKIFKDRLKKGETAGR
ncbi:MAG: peptide-methionine (S)-S-oxide reductase MsrA [Chitinophagaceae bacterium]|jgi:peptide-methionine (S)-S-oxide reductase|nr:peptide-methionine (S)-S-oxide reductase MsrA [Chitinophagaceae bacterium]